MRRLRTEMYWDEQVKKAQDTQIFVLTQLIQSELVLEAKLTELPAIALAMVLASDCVQQQTEAESRIRAWRTSPPWANTDSLLTALAPSDWSSWQINAGRPLYVWEDQLRFQGHETTRRLQMAAELFNPPQPRLQTWLAELTTTESPLLLNLLKLAWQQAQQQANALAPILRALANPSWQGDLFAQAQLTESLESTDSYDDQALAAIILGDSVPLVEKAVTAWLEKSAPLKQNQSIFEQLNALKQRFNHLVAVYQPTHPQLANQVHEWASVLLTEIMPLFPPGTSADLTQLWDLLERGRIGLTGLTMRLPTDWQAQLGKVLWQSLAQSIYFIGEGNDTTDHPWPLSLKFIEITNSWQEKRPSVAEAQQCLFADEALVQLFLDTQRDCYRVLWLDRDGLQLRELPADCAAANLWRVPELKTGVIDQWHRGLQGLKSQARSGGFGGIANNEDMRAWTAVLEATPVQRLASTLHNWAVAANLNQLIVIFPAPLGQLPWEALPGLESLAEKLVRAISVTHWLTTTGLERRLSQLTHYWVTADPNDKEPCMQTEARWVSQCLNATLTMPCEYLIDMIDEIKQSDWLHLATHGEFNRHHPLASYLSLDTREQEATEKRYFPLWLASTLTTKAELIMLSACESNLYGIDTSGLVTPIGIGPTLAAIGANTVVGSLWPVNGLAALCFNYHFYTIAQQQQDLAWHQIVAQAKLKLKGMNVDDLKKVKEKLGLEKDLCKYAVHKSIGTGKPREKQPFNHPQYWAGFVALH